MELEPERTLVRVEAGADRATAEGDGRVGSGRACGLRHGRGRRRRRSMEEVRVRRSARPWAEVWTRAEARPGVGGGKRGKGGEVMLVGC